MTTTSSWWYKNRLAEESVKPIVEAKEEKLHIVVIGKDNGENTFAGIIGDLCKKKKIDFNFIDVTEAWISNRDVEIGTVEIQNIDGKDTSVVLERATTIIFPRAGAVETLTSQSMLLLLQDAGFFVVNDLQSMLLCDNKMSNALMLERNNVPIPRTSILSNANSIEHAFESIGGKFPVIIKTLIGAQGVGVSKVNDMASLTSVAQSLWKFDASLLLQEFLEIESDIRSLVVGGKLLGAAERIRGENDSKEFRNNTHLGADTEPYKMSEEEIKIVESAARASGSLYCGVDHAIYKGKPYVLEVNGSPGIKSSYMLYDHITSKQKGKTTAEEILTEVINYFQLETHRRPIMRQEAGYIETIILEGMESQPIRAKLDTGNGAKASMLHVNKLEVKGKKVFWEKNGKKFESDVIGTSRAHRGGKLFEERPIIQETAVFNNKKYPALIGLSVKDTASEMLVNRELLTMFKVSVNPNRKFILSDWTSRNDKTDD